MNKPINTEEEFKESCKFAYRLLGYVDSISGNNKWWFKAAQKISDESYKVIFTSFDTPEYSKFLLSVQVTKVDNKYNFEIIEQVTDLT